MASRATSEARIVRLSGEELLTRRAEIAAIYRAVFTGPPYRESELDVAWFERALRRHVEREAFRVVAAVTGPPRRRSARSAVGQVVGFAFGASGKAGEGWYDMIRARLPEEVAAAWMGPQEGWPFELMELAVLPAWQGSGIGGRLHDALLDGLPHPAALLTTAAEETTATHLYRSRGWVELAAPFTFHGSDVRFVLMGLRLHNSQMPKRSRRVV
ncbi:MAG: GNAT family N-acetyltransferase [Candidatus Promineifilaceae bacterium]|nr:GNAT family N-acetyltransferase [Candidatus Promineifilaceae bacterium]